MEDVETGEPLGDAVVDVTFTRGRHVEIRTLGGTHRGHEGRLPAQPDREDHVPDQPRDGRRRVLVLRLRRQGATEGAPPGRRVIRTRATRIAAHQRSPRSDAPARSRRCGPDGIEDGVPRHRVRQPRQTLPTAGSGGSAVAPRHRSTVGRDLRMMGRCSSGCHHRTGCSRVTRPSAGAMCDLAGVPDEQWRCERQRGASPPMGGRASAAGSAG